MFLIGCKGTIKPKILCDVSFQSNRCRCTCYDSEKLQSTDPIKCKIESEEWTWNSPLEVCEGITGFYIEDIAEHIIPKINEKKQYIKDKCGIE